MSSLLQYIHENKQDAILFKSRTWLQAAKEADDPHEKTEAVKRIARIISFIKDPTLQTFYVENVAADKGNRLKIRVLADMVTALTGTSDSEFTREVDNWENFPGYMDREDIEMKGFCEVQAKGKFGYYGWTAAGKTEISNFIIRPIFQVSGKGEDSRHIIEVVNQYRSATVDIKSKALVSLDTLQTELVAEGNYIFFGTRAQLLRIASELLPQFPKCDEVKQLGWQPEGFFAYVDRLYIPSAKNYTNEDGTPRKGYVTLSKWGIAEVFGKSFLIPASSSVYENLRDDNFKMVRVLEHRTSPVAFKDWATQLHRVYVDDGLIGLAFILCTVFRDLVFKVDNNFPHLYAYGETSSGKSQWAASLVAFFFNGRAAFNLNSGTDHAFFDYMASFRNCLAHLNEFDDKVVKDEWFQAIKGIFDGEGRRRGKMGRGMQTEVQESNSGLILTGQYLSTKDDNSIVTRSLIRGFYKRDFTEEQRAQYDLLKDWEEKGISGLITDVLEHRELIESRYYDTFNELLGQWRRTTAGEFNSRIFQNWCHLAAMWQLLVDRLHLPVSGNEFAALAYNNAKAMSSFIRSSDTLTEFWNTVAFLLDQRQIIDGWDFKIETKVSIKIRGGDEAEREQLFNEPRKLLVIRLNTVHKLYQKAYKERTGKEAMTLENLKHYFSNRNYYIGVMKQTRFRKFEHRPIEKSVNHGGLNMPVTTTSVSSEYVPVEQITSAYVFDYDLLGCELERGDGSQPELAF